MTNNRQQLPINLASISDALAKPIGLIDDAERRADIERFLESGRVHQERAVLDLLSQVVNALNESGSSGHAGLEVIPGGYALNIAANGPEPEAEPVFDATDEIERVTVRMPRRLKLAIDQIAEQSGHSTNSVYVRMLARAAAHRLRDRERSGRHEHAGEGRQASEGRRERRRRHGRGVQNPD